MGRIVFVDFFETLLHNIDQLSLHENIVSINQIILPTL